MKKIDIKSLLIGILLGTNLMFLFGAKTMDCDDNYYEIRKVKRTVESIESTLSIVAIEVSSAANEASRAAEHASLIRLYGVNCN